MSAETQARPDLSALDRETRINIAVAETQGATWMEGDGLLSWRLHNKDGSQLAVIWRESGGLSWRALRYTRDPAAWGALVEKEVCWTHPVFSLEGGNLAGWRPRHEFDGDALLYPVSTPGLAVSLACLAKYGVEVPS